MAAVEAASTVRRVTEPILRAVLATDAAGAAFAALRGLPFTEPGADGLLLHDVVRDTVGLDLDVRDPEARRTYRRRAARYFTERAASARGDLWQVTADLMFLIENPVVRDACFPTSRPEYVVEPARPEDAGPIEEIAVRHETPAAAAAIARWWARHPETFAVARGADRTVEAFVQIAELGRLDPALLERDPLAAPWLEHLRAVPPGAGDKVLLMRRWLGRESGELRSAPVSACWLDVKRVYMELRTGLRRLYSTVVDLPRLGPIFLPLGFAPVGAPVELDGHRSPGRLARLRARQRRRLAGPSRRRRDRTRTGRGCGTDRTRAPGARPAGAGSHEPGHRRAAPHQREDGGPARVQHLRQTRRAHPRRGGPHRHRTRARRG